MSLSIGGKHSIFSTTVSVLVDNPKYSIQNYIVSPAPLENKTKKIICKCINEFLMQIKLINGVAHTEVKVENDKAYIIESQTRIGGDKIYKSVSLTTSYCQINEYFKYLFNPKKFKTHKILPSNCITCYACILFKKGKIETLDTSKLSKINEIIEYNIVAKEGDLIKTMKDNTKRGGFVYFKIDNYKDIDIVLDKIKQAIHVVYDDKTIYKINFEKFL